MKRRDTMSLRRAAGALAGLMGCAPHRNDRRHRAASIVDRLLKRALPVSLPVEEPATFEPVIHRRRAQASGLPIPQAPRLRAGEVIQ
jgi:ABC-type uncharacterized transport system substrate-binding protein